jgi:excisionase family DNA binding protein
MPLAERAPISDSDTPMWLSVGEVAYILGVHPQTVYSGLKNGKLPFRSVKIGRIWRIPRVDVEAHAAYLRGEVEQ